MSFKILVLDGSPRKGNTYNLLNAAIEGAEKYGAIIERINVQEIETYPTFA